MWGSGKGGSEKWIGYNAVFAIVMSPFCNSSCPGGPIPQNMAWALMPRQPYSVAVPSTGGRFPSSRLRFLFPANGGTEGGVKTIEEDRDERWSLL